jgi:hypothetical protein
MTKLMILSVLLVAIGTGFVLGVFAARHNAPPVAAIVSLKTWIERATGAPRQWRRAFHDDPTGYLPAECPPHSFVILAGGQSNAANSLSDPLDARENLPAFMLHGGHCYRLADPVLGATDHRGSLWTALGHRIAERGVPVVIIATGVGATTFADWVEPRSGYLSRTRAEIDAARARGVEVNVVVWQQGESDAKLDRDQRRHEAALEALVDALYDRLALPATTRTVLFRSSIDRGRPPKPVLIAAIDAVIARDPRLIAGPETDRLGPRFRYDGGHFNARGRDRIVDETLTILMPVIEAKRLGLPQQPAGRTNSGIAPPSTSHE